MLRTVVGKKVVSTIKVDSIDKTNWWYETAIVSNRGIFIVKTTPHRSEAIATHDKYVVRLQMVDELKNKE